ncbi:hypothetical protein KNP414_03002 [Paenibacillus mucilaginosus KNP414]|uniref:Uncharacterized protein n=1 Tax=Paenibacillus mucilaginosus (strain KNP414) TaxID=1036673 RepID=F8F8H2_PAEMK|nr:hypothetical protein KNP414_03002 [Paenibacillus mucilaginosus KNP414]
MPRFAGEASSHSGAEPFFTGSGRLREAGIRDECPAAGGKREGSHELPSFRES